MGKVGDTAQEELKPALVDTTCRRRNDLTTVSDRRLLRGMLLRLSQKLGQSR